MAVMVVIMVIMVLSGLGILATRAASLTASAAGSMRQMSQTHYITDYAMQAAFAELSSDRQPAYVQLMSNTSTQNNAGATECQSLLNVPYRTCLKLTKADLERVLRIALPNATYLMNKAKNGGYSSLGVADNIANFAVEITDLMPVPSPVAGADVAGSGGAAMSFYMVTLTATGMVMPNPSPNSLDDQNAFTGNQLTDRASAIVASQELARAHVVVGPLPAKL